MFQYLYAYEIKRMHKRTMRLHSTFESAVSYLFSLYEKDLSNIKGAYDPNSPLWAGFDLKIIGTKSFERQKEKHIPKNFTSWFVHSGNKYFHKIYKFSLDTNIEPQKVNPKEIEDSVKKLKLEE